MAVPLQNVPWVEAFQKFVHYSVGPIESTPAVNVGSLLAAGVGIALVLRSRHLLRPVVTAVGLIVGTWFGIELARFIGTPAPITAALVAVCLSALAFRTYRVWLVAGSVVMLFTLATTYQLGRGDLTRYLPEEKKSAVIELPDAVQQQKNLHPDPREHLSRVAERIGAEMRTLGPRGWLLPTLAAVIGAILAWKALNVFAIIWMALLGACMAVFGGITFLCANWPDLRTPIITHPQAVGGTMLGLWLLGLVLQAREARFPKAPPPAPAKKDSPKS
jgi:hypothetical protein